MRGCPFRGYEVTIEGVSASPKGSRFRSRIRCANLTFQHNPRESDAVGCDAEGSRGMDYRQLVMQKSCCEYVRLQRKQRLS